MGIVISAENLYKEFKVREKKRGFKGLVSSIFKPDIIIKTALNGISMEIEQGEIIGFIGPNGAGKTTTLKILSGILYQTKGNVKVLGFVPSNRKVEFLSKISMVMGNKSQLSWDLPVIDSFNLLKNIYGLSDVFFTNQLDSLGKIFDISKLLKQPVRQLSLGERMKCELAASLIHAPKVVFLDEPTLGLDAVSQRNFRQMIKEQNSVHGTTFLITSHYMKDIKELCNRVIVINNGEKIFDGQLLDLQKKYAPNKRVSIWLEKEICDLENQLSKILSEINIIKCSGVNVEFTVSRRDTANAISKLIGFLPVIDLSIQEPAIDEIIHRAYQEEGKSF